MENKIEKRKYQLRDAKDIITNLDAGNNVMYQLPTGGGKSKVAADVVHNYHEKEILILAHRRELVLAMSKRLTSDKITPSVYVGEIESDTGSNITIGSINKLSRDKRLETILNKKVDFVIVDEGHHLRTPSYDKIINHLREINPNLLILALTATPWRSDKKDFREYIDTLITSESVDSLIEQGFLCNFRTFVTTIGDIDKEVEKNENDYNITALSRYMRQDVFIQHAVDQYREKGEDRQTLIYAVDSLHLQAVQQKFIEEGYTSIAAITANTPIKERDQIIQDYLDKKLKFIISIGTLTEGTDLPDTGCLLVLRPTESLILFHQILGRGMRRKSDGSDLIILDCAGITKKHGSVNSPRDWSLDPLVDPKERTKRSKIVGRRKDGSYSDDIKEIESGDLEVIEMTPEEYLNHSANAIEEATEYNKKVVTEIETKRDEFKNSTLLDLLKLTLGIEKIFPGRDSWDKEALSYDLKEVIGDGYVLKFESDRKTGFLMPSLERPWSNKTNLTELKANELLGNLSTKILKDPKNFNNLSLKEELKVLEESKIDIDKIKEAKKEFENTQFIKKLEKYLLENNTIKFDKHFEVGNIFPTQWGRFNTVVFSKNKLLSTNEVSFRNEDGREIYLCKWMEKQKLVDYLIEKKWNPETELIQN